MFMVPSLDGLAGKRNQFKIRRSDQRDDMKRNQIAGVQIRGVASLFRMGVTEDSSREVLAMKKQIMTTMFAALIAMPLAMPSAAIADRNHRHD
jgi:hypothetical protein